MRIISSPLPLFLSKKKKILELPKWNNIGLFVQGQIQTFKRPADVQRQNPIRTLLSKRPW